jgi:hypothetical protein
MIMTTFEKIDHMADYDSAPPLTFNVTDVACGIEIDMPQLGQKLRIEYDNNQVRLYHQARGRTRREEAEVLVITEDVERDRVSVSA